MSTILAIIREPESLTLIQITRTLKKTRINQFALRALPAGADWEQVAQTSKEMIKEHDLQSQKIILGLPSTLCFLRQLKFPFTKQDKIRQVIKFELEQTFPQDIEQTIVDFIKTEPDFDTAHPFLAAIVHKETIDSAISAFKKMELELDIIDLNLSGLDALARYSSAAGEDPALFVHLDWSGTTILLRSKNSINKIRSINFGLKNLVPRILPQANRNDKDILNNLKSPAAPEIREAVTEVMTRIVREVELSVAEAGQFSENLNLHYVYLSGEASDFFCIQNELHKLLKLPIVKLQDKINHDLTTKQNFSQIFPQIGLALGLALTRTQKSPAFNFRRDEFARLQSYTKWKKHIIYASVSCALLFFSWLGTELFQIHLLTNQLKDMENKIDTVFQRAVPQVSDNFIAAQYPSIIKSQISQYQGKPENVQKMNFHKTLIPLREISALISNNYNIKISLYIFDNDRIRISGVADEFNTIEKIKNILQKNEQFSTVNIKGAKSTNNNQGINFSLEIMLA